MKNYSEVKGKALICPHNKRLLTKTVAVVLTIITVLGLFPISAMAAEIDSTYPNTSSYDEANIVPVGANKHIIPNVPYMDQDELPTGCETVTAAMLLKYYGMNISPKDFANKYLIKKSLSYDNYGNLWGPDPDSAFVGNPESYSSYGIFSPAMAKSMNKYLDKINAPFEAVSIRGLSLSEVCSKYIDNDRPVMVWATMYMVASYKTTLWYIDYLDENSSMKKGDSFRWTAEEHCLLLVGYDSKNYYFNDPLTDAYYAYSKSVVETRYKELKKSIVILEPINTYLSVNCKDENGNALEGTKVSFCDAKTNKLIETVTADKDGNAKTSKAFSIGKYSVSINPPQNYEVVDAPETVEVTKDNCNKEISISVKCQLKKGYIIAEAYDIEGNPIKGISFDVYNKDNQLVTTLPATGEDGYTISQGGYDEPSIPYGTYTIRIGEVSDTTLYATVDEWEIILDDSMSHSGQIDVTFIKTLIYGDINLDGIINIKDSTKLQKYVAELISLSETALSVSDVNKDGKTDIQDATLIQKHIAKMQTDSCIGTVLEQ